MSESVFSCVQPVLIDKCHRVPALGGVCISECVLGYCHLPLQVIFSGREPSEWAVPAKRGSEASWMPCPGFGG